MLGANPKHRLRSEKLLWPFFRTGVRFPSPPPNNNDQERVPDNPLFFIASLVNVKYYNEPLFPIPESQSNITLGSPV